MRRRNVGENRRSPKRKRDFAFCTKAISNKVSQFSSSYHGVFVILYHDAVIIFSLVFRYTRTPRRILTNREETSLENGDSKSLVRQRNPKIKEVQYLAADLASDQASRTAIYSKGKANLDPMASSSR